MEGKEKKRGGSGCMQTRRERLSMLSCLFSPNVVGKGEEQKSRMDSYIHLVTAVETIGNRKLKDFGRENLLFQVPVEGTPDHHHSFFSQGCFKSPCGESCSRQELARESGPI